MTMADERTCYAGDLTTDQIGKRISVVTESGAAVEDELLEIRYFASELVPSGAKSDGAEPPRVWLRFRNVAPAAPEGRFRDFPIDAGFWVGHVSSAVVYR